MCQIGLKFDLLISLAFIYLHYLPLCVHTLLQGVCQIREISEESGKWIML